MFKKKKSFSPIMTFLILTLATVIVSGVLHLFNVQSEYASISKATDGLVNNVIEVNNLFSISGLRHIVSSAVNGFVNFGPLSILIIVLIGIGVLEKAGFLKTFFTLLTRNSKKNTITFILIFLSLLFSFFGDIGFVIMLPLSALLFKYGRRNPLGGIITSFASLSFGAGINVLLSQVDSSLLDITLSSAALVDSNSRIGVFFALFIMTLVLFITAFVFTYVTEKRIIPKLPRYDVEEEEFVITNKELRGLIVGIGAGILYILLIAYMIIPGLPLSGGLLDPNGARYIEMLFGANSLFNKGFVFIVTLLFVVIGYFYGIMTKSIKSSKDFTECLSYSLDGIGNILVLMFFASLFINVFNESNIGQVLTAFISNVIGKLNFTGVWLIVITIALIAIVNIFCPSVINKWTMLSPSIVPLFMNASISPEFAQVLYVASCSMTNGITPLFTYFVIYLAIYEKYNKNEATSVFGCIKHMSPYAIYISLIWIAVLVGWYLIGLPIGIGSLPGVIYGA